MLNLCHNEPHIDALSIINILLTHPSKKIFTPQKPQPCPSLLVGGSSFTLFKIGNDTFSKIN